MEIQKLLEKLEPLMPTAVNRWRRGLELADGRTKELLERHIRHVGVARFGISGTSTLLSLPPENKARGSIELGTILYEKRKWPLGISSSELLQNLAIFGRSGAGKTNVAFHLLTQLSRKRINFLFLDWKRTCRHLLPLLGRNVALYTAGRSLSPFPFNPFLVPPGIERSVYVNQVIDVLAAAYTLGDGAKSILHRVLTDVYSSKSRAPTFEELLLALDKLPTRERATGWKISARRAVESAEIAIGAGTTMKSQTKFMKDLLSKSTIVELDSLSESSKKFVIPLLCFWLYSVRLSQEDRERLRHVIFVEEAHHVLLESASRARGSLMNVLLRQCRELGIGFVIVDQQPHLISSSVLANCYTTICLNQRNPADVRKAAAISMVDESEKRLFQTLPVGHGVVKLQDRWRLPVRVRFGLMPVRKGAVTDAVLESWLQGRRSLQSLRERDSKNRNVDSDSRYPDKRLDGSIVMLLLDVVRFPNDGVDARYKRLGLSVDRGNRCKESLVRQGIVLASRKRVGKTTRVILTPTVRATAAFGLKVNPIGRESLIHNYWKNWYADFLVKEGYFVHQEWPRLARRNRGRMDIFAWRVAESVESLAVEIETGASDFVDNVKRDLREGVDKVIVIGSTNDAVKIIGRTLRRTKLFSAGRVEIWGAGKVRALTGAI